MRKGGQRMTHVPPLDPLSTLIENFQARGGTIWDCPPCVTSRGYTKEDMLDGVIIVGASAVHAEIKQGRRRCRFDEETAEPGGSLGSVSRRRHSSRAEIYLCDCIDIHAILTGWRGGFDDIREG